jgi:hypothetical protein
MSLTSTRRRPEISNFTNDTNARVHQREDHRAILSEPEIKPDQSFGTLHPSSSMPTRSCAGATVLMAVFSFVSMDLKHPSRSQPERTRREDRHLKFYELRDNLPRAHCTFKVILPSRSCRLRTHPQNPCSGGQLRGPDHRGRTCFMHDPG